MKYAIKKTYIATDRNTNFKGQTQVWYYARGGYGHKEIDWYIKQDAYKTKTSVANGLKAAQKLKEWEEKAGYWTINLEVVEVE